MPDTSFPKGSSADLGESNPADVRRVLRRIEADGVVVLTMNDPKTRNAMDEEMYESLLRYVREFRDNDAQSVLVLAGAAGSFSSGINTRELTGKPRASRADAEASAADPLGKRPLALIKSLYDCEKLTIAAIDGAAYGVGLGVALCCDFRLASPAARLCEAFVKNGLVPGDGSTWQLPRIVGPARSLWMQCTAEVVDADEAYRIGLVDAVVNDSTAAGAALELAHRFADGPLTAVQLVKQLVRRSERDSFGEHLVAAAGAQEIVRRERTRSS